MFEIIKAIHGSKTGEHATNDAARTVWNIVCTAAAAAKFSYTYVTRQKRRELRVRRKTVAPLETECNIEIVIH